MCAVSALNPQRFRGFGPSDPLLLDQLIVFKSCTRFQMQPSTEEDETVHTVGNNSSSVADFPLYSGNLAPFTGLDRLYELSADSVLQETGMSAQVYGLSRLRSILKIEHNGKHQGPLMLSKRYKNISGKRKRGSPSRTETETDADWTSGSS
jgi:hypothetical protein